MLYPEAAYKPVQNHGGPMNTIQGLVLHVQQGNGSLFGYFNNPSSQVSAHFWVSKTGILEQYVDTGTVAWAEAAGNLYYLSIETEGFDTEPLTEAQMEVIANLLIWMNHQFETPLVGPVAHGADGFTQHCNPDGTPDPAWGNHTCPGTIRLGQMPEIIDLTNVPISTIEGELFEMVLVTIDGVEYAVSTVVTGDSKHVVQIRQLASSIGQKSTTANTSIIDLTAQWPGQLS